MRLFLTEIYALSRISGEVERFNGPDVYAITAKEAQENLDSKGLAYCRVTFEAVEVIDMPHGNNIIKQRPKFN